MTRTYTLEMTEKQASVVQDALELYTRIGCGQFDEIACMPHLQQNASDNAGKPLPRYDVGRSIREALQFLVPSSFSGSACYGIHSPDIHDDVKHAYDIMRVIRHRIAWTLNPAGSRMSVAFDDPAFCRAISSEPLAAMTLKAE